MKHQAMLASVASCETGVVIVKISPALSWTGFPLGEVKAPSVPPVQVIAPVEPPFCDMAYAVVPVAAVVALANDPA